MSIVAPAYGYGRGFAIVVVLFILLIILLEPFLFMVVINQANRF
ncbi:MULTISPECIES: YjcZ family sporulation protein [Bacillaceae]|nr:MULTISPECIES: YjcZ family sporulation protein [Bacillaceae]